MVAIMLIAAVVTILWSVLFLRRTGLVGGCFAVLLAGSVIGYPFFRVDVGGIPVTIDRILLLVLLVIFGVLWWLDMLEKRRVDWQDAGVLVFTAILALSMFAHGGTPHTVASFFAFYIIPLAIYWILRSTPITHRAVWNLVTATAAFGLYLAVTSVLEQQQITALVFPRYIASPKFGEFLGRGRGPFLNPAGNGLYMIAGLVGLLLLWPHARRFGRVLIVLSAGVLVAGIACTLTRIVWGAAALAVMVVAFASLPRRWSIAFALTFVVVSTGVVALKWNDVTAFKRDKYVSVNDMAESARMRPMLVYIAWRMFLDRPLTGCGFGRYPDESIYYLADRTTSLPLEKVRNYIQHNVALSLLTETGLVGVGAFLLMMGFWLVTAWHLYANQGHALPVRQLGMFVITTIAVYFTIGMFHDLTIVPMANVIVYFMAGVARSVAAAEFASAGGDARVAAQWTDRDQTPSLSAWCKS